MRTYCLVMSWLVTVMRSESHVHRVMYRYAWRCTLETDEIRGHISTMHVCSARCPVVPQGVLALKHDARFHDTTGLDKQSVCVRGKDMKNVRVLPAVLAGWSDHSLR